jgi:hypothetical protein
MPPEALSTARPTPLRLWGFLLTAIGGALAGLGALLDWATVGFPGDTRGNLDLPVKGIDIWEGKVALLAALLALIGTAAIRLMRGIRGRRSVTATIVVLGALTAALALSVMLRPEVRLGEDNRVDEIAANLAAQLGEDQEQVRAELARQFGDQLRVDLGAGVWIAAAGGVLLAVGGSLSLAWASREAEGSAASGTSRRIGSDPVEPMNPDGTNEPR